MSRFTQFTDILLGKPLASHYPKDGGSYTGARENLGKRLLMQAFADDCTA